MSAMPTPIEVFCSYAREDDTWVGKLEIHLSALKRQGLISLWSSRLIAPGTDWRKAIDAHLETASIILLLISADFLASDYCYSREMKRALERHEAGEACIVPILVRPVDWKGVPFAHLQALPTDTRPLATWKDQERALATVAMSLRQMIEELPLSTASVHSTVQPSIWNVPYLRNFHFTGRDKLLDRLHQQLSPQVQGESMATRSAALTQTQAIKGLGGIGKTQIAVEYAYRARDQGHYTHILWFNAASEESIMTSFMAIAELLPGLSAKRETDQNKLVAAIKRWLEECKQHWLLIFDNADEVSLVHKYLPQQGDGSILLTTRANAVGSLAVSIEVETMSFIEGTHLLLRRAQRFDSASDEEINHAGNIVVALDHFPLALDQAGAYIEETQCSLVDYLSAYQNHRKELLARRGKQVTGYPDSVATTWSLSFQKVEQANPAAAELLSLCAFLSPDHIPEEFIKYSAVHWPSLLQQAVADSFILNQMIEELLKFSLVKRLVKDQMLSIHRLVQVVQIDRMEPDIQRQWARRVILAVNEIFPRAPENAATWPQCLRYLDQAQACDALIQQYTLTLSEASDLLHRTADYLQRHASYAIAEPLYQRALSIREQQVASSLNGLALLYVQQGKYAEAERLYQQALHILEQQLGSDHPEVARLLNDLGVLYREQGKDAEAERLYQRALHILEQLLGPDHLEVAQPLNDLGVFYSKQGRHAEAERLYQRALHIREQKLGPDHLQVAQSLTNLAIFYFEQGKYAEAEPLHQRALHILEQQLGPEHPYVAYPLYGLADLYAEQGKYAEAEMHHQRALHIREQQLGPEHPLVAQSLNELAIVYFEQGKYAEAEPLYQRALHIREQQLGQDHYEVAYPLHGLANLYAKQGKYAEAEMHHQRTLRIREQQLGPDHYEVAYPLHGLANLYAKQGKYAEVEPLYRRALHILEQQLGPEHLETSQIIHDLAVFQEAQGNHQEAFSLYQHALSIREQALGSEHLKTRATRQRLTSLRLLVSQEVVASPEDGTLLEQREKNS